MAVEAGTDDGADGEEEEEARRGAIVARVGGWRTNVRYTAAMTIECRGYKSQISERYVSFIINLQVRL